MDFQKLMVYRNTYNTFAIHLGIRIVEVRAGYARAEKDITEADLNDAKQLHGGVFFTMADAVGETAAVSLDKTSVTLSSNYNFLRSAFLGDHLIAESQVVKAGKTITVCDVTIRNQNGILLGNGSFSFFCLKDGAPC